MDEVDGVPLRKTSNFDNTDVFTPPFDFGSPNALAPNGNGAKVSPMQIPNRESVSSASDLPIPTSPGQPASQPSSLNLIPHVSLQLLGSSPGSIASDTDMDYKPLYDLKQQQLEQAEKAHKDYQKLYELKQQQFEQAEKAYKETLTEVMQARTSAEQLAERLQQELLEEAKAARKLEETMTAKFEVQLQEAKGMWLREREVLFQRVKDKEAQISSLAMKVECLTMRKEQLKAKLRVTGAGGTFANNSAPAGPSSAPAGPSSLPLGRPHSPSIPLVPRAHLRSFSPSARQNQSDEASSSSSNNDRNGSADRDSYGPRGMTPNSRRLEDYPYEPPSSTIPPMSPPPAEYRRHAGHTPGASVSLLSPGNEAEEEEDASPGSDTPTQSSFASLAAIANGTVPAAQLDTVDEEEDLPLKGTLGLKNRPEDSTWFLEELDKKLKELSKEDEDEDVDAFPPLRLKASMNFGAPLGKGL